jgi:hypothetical protein
MIDFAVAQRMRRSAHNTRLVQCRGVALPLKWLPRRRAPRTLELRSPVDRFGPLLTNQFQPLSYGVGEYVQDS